MSGFTKFTEAMLEATKLDEDSNPDEDSHTDLETQTVDERLLSKNHWSLGKKLTISIRELEMCGRSVNCLKTACITNVGELIEMTPRQLLKKRNFGEGSLKEVQQKLRMLGLALRGCA